MNTAAACVHECVLATNESCRKQKRSLATGNPKRRDVQRAAVVRGTTKTKERRRRWVVSRFRINMQISGGRTGARIKIPAGSGGGGSRGRRHRSRALRVFDVGRAQAQRRRSSRLADAQRTAGAGGRQPLQGRARRVLTQLACPRCNKWLIHSIQLLRAPGSR
jgi:hypothetical protein